MGATISRLVGIGLLLLLSDSLAAAGAPDLRLVNAAAEENTQAVRALLDEGVDVNTPASDGLRRFSGRPTGITWRWLTC